MLDIGKRDRHPLMDTDSERDHEYFFIMYFQDKQQCNRAVDYIYAGKESGKLIRETTYSKIEVPVCICWDDFIQLGFYSA